MVSEKTITQPQGAAPLGLSGLQSRLVATAAQITDVQRYLSRADTQGDTEVFREWWLGYVDESDNFTDSRYKVARAAPDLSLVSGDVLSLVADETADQADSIVDVTNLTESEAATHLLVKGTPLLCWTTTGGTGEQHHFTVTSSGVSPVYFGKLTMGWIGNVNYVYVQQCDIDGNILKPETINIRLSAVLGDIPVGYTGLTAGRIISYAPIDSSFGQAYNLPPVVPSIGTQRYQVFQMTTNFNTGWDYVRMSL